MLSTVDIIVIILYFIGMLAIGYLYREKSKTAKDYVVAARSFGLGILVSTFVATGLGAGNLFGRSGYAYNAGGAMLVAMLGYLAGLVTAAIIAGRLRGHDDLVSMPDILAKRFGNTPGAMGIRTVTSLYTFLYCALIVGLQFSALGRVFTFFGGSFGIEANTGLIIGALILIAYTYMGGFYAVAWTDVAQFVLMVTGVIIIGPIVSVWAAGGYEPILANTAAAGITIWNPFSGRAAKEIFGLFMVSWFLNAVDPFVWQRVFAAKSISTARKAITINWVISFLFAFGLVQMAVAARVILPDLVQNFGTAEAVLPALVTTVFPTVLAGLMVAGMLATIMSSGDSYLLMASNALLYDLVGKVKKDITDQQMVKLLRLGVLIVGLLGMGVALWFKGVFTLLIFAFSMYGAGMFFPFLGAIYWRKVTYQGMIVSMILGGGLVIYGYFAKWYPFGYDPQILGSIVSGVALVLVSLLTQSTGLPSMPEYTAKEEKPVSL